MDLARLPAIAGTQPHPRAHGVAVRACTDEDELEPVRGTALVAQELGGLMVVPQHQVELAVAIEVGDRETAAVLDTVGAVDVGDVGEGAVAVVPKEDLVLIAVQVVLADVPEVACHAVGWSTGSL